MPYVGNFLNNLISLATSVTECLKHRFGVRPSVRLLAPAVTQQQQRRMGISSTQPAYVSALLTEGRYTILVCPQVVAGHTRQTL